MNNELDFLIEAAKKEAAEEPSSKPQPAEQPPAEQPQAKPSRASALERTTRNRGMKVIVNLMQMKMASKSLELIHGNRISGDSELTDEEIEFIVNQVGSLKKSATELMDYQRRTTDPESPEFEHSSEQSSTPAPSTPTKSRTPRAPRRNIPRGPGGKFARKDQSTPPSSPPPPAVSESRMKKEFKRDLEKPVPNHPYHEKSDEELSRIIEDAKEAARFMRQNNPSLEAQYLNKIITAESILNYRMYGGQRVWGDQPKIEMPLKGHSFHQEPDRALRHIADDSRAAAQAMRGYDPEAERRFSERAEAAEKILEYRQKGGRRVDPRSPK